MSVRMPQKDRAYGLSKDLISLGTLPIITTRNPTTHDIADIGQLWINKSANTFCFATSKAAGLTTWSTPMAVAGNLNVVGTGTIGLGLTVSAGGADITGNSSVTGTLSTTSTLTVGTSLAVTTSAVIGTNLTLTNGNITLSGATKGLYLPGPVKIISGAGVPANGLAAEVGDIYINTTAATALTRIYIATGAGAWTNLTCAA